jgi:uncharacterized delta-60 repeat protein
MKKNYLQLKAIAGIGIAFSFFSTIAIAQAGKNDSTFNVPDSGPDAVYKGSNYSIRLSALQSDNSKIVLGGEFSVYNSEAHGRIVRILTDGSVDHSFVSGTGLNDQPMTIAVQTDNRIIAAGDFTSYNGTAVNRIVRLQENGAVDSSFLTGSGFNGIVRHSILQSDGKLVVLGGFTIYNGQPVKRLIRLNTNGIIDSTFNAYDTTYAAARRFTIQPDGKIIVALSTIEHLKLIRLNTDGTRDASYTADLASFDMSYNPIPQAIAIQPDGKVIISGNGFQGNSQDIAFLKRINTNGTEDTTFDPLNPEGAGGIYALSLQTDGKIIIAGHKERDSGVEHTNAQYIARLNADGTIDESFLHTNKYYSGAYSVYTTTVLPNGKILAAGFFPEINTFSAHNIALLNTDGTLDILFNKTTGVNGTIKASAIQADQKIIIGGLFSGVQFQSRNHIARLLADGSLDNSFNPGTGTNGNVYAVTAQADGKIVIGGDFTTYNNQTVQNLVRVHANGNIDTTYTPTVNGIVYSLEVQNDNKLIVGGSYVQVNGETRFNLVRLNSDGALDPAFISEVTASENPSAVYTTSILSDGKILVGGNFTAKHNTTTRKHLVRFNANGTVDETFQQVDFSHYRDIAIQPDGKIIACGGAVGRWPSGPTGFIDRYNADGTSDGTWENSFEPGINPLYTLTLLSNGKTVVGGEFDWFFNQGKEYIMLIDSTGNIDPSFIGTINGPVYTSQAVANGKVIIGGAFEIYTGITRNNIARIFGSDDIINSIKNHTANSSFSVYPNPATGVIHADHLKQGSFITIRNIAGALLHTERVTNDRVVINVSGYSNGIYFITQQSKEQVSTQRFIILNDN